MVSHQIKIKNHYKPLRRETLTKDLRKLAESFPHNPNLSSHSFRIGLMTQLWKNTNDIEFVRQAIDILKSSLPLY